MDESCQTDAAGIYCLWGDRAILLRGEGLMEAAVITVYGVLFLDWKQENQPFQGVCVDLRGGKYCADMTADS